MAKLMKGYPDDHEHLYRVLSGYLFTAACIYCGKPGSVK